MIPKTSNEAELLSRIQKLESENLGGTKEQNYHQNSGNRDTGRTDKFSDENPRKDYDDYRKQYLKSNPRQQAKQNNKFLGKDSFESLKTALTSLDNTDKAHRGPKFQQSLNEIRERILTALPTLPDEQQVEIKRLLFSILNLRTY